MRLIVILIVALMLSGCASTQSLPKSSDKVSFDMSEEGKTGWSEYQSTMFVKGVDKRTAYLAAKSGLSDAGFTIQKASFDKLYAIGEHGMTRYDWNIVAGVYIKKETDGAFIKAIVEGSKDTGLWGDMTAASWPQEIFKGVREYILTQSQIEDTDKDIFR